MDPVTIAMLVQAGASILGNLTSKSGTVSQEALETDEQKTARKNLLDMAGGMKAYEGEMGSFKLSDLEQSAADMIGSRLGSALPETFTAGSKELLDILNQDAGSYDPASGDLYKGMRREIRRAGRDEEDVLSRQAAVSGDLYSTDINRRKGELAERTSNKLSDTLAGLTENYANRRMTAAGQAISAGQTEEGLVSSRIGAAASAGALQRMLKDAELKAKYAEWQRNQGQQIDTLAKVLGSQPEFGVKDMEWSEDTSGYDKMLSDAMNTYTQYLINKKA